MCASLLGASCEREREHTLGSVSCALRPKHTQTLSPNNRAYIIFKLFVPQTCPRPMHARARSRNGRSVNAPRPDKTVFKLALCDVQMPAAEVFQLQRASRRRRRQPRVASVRFATLPSFGVHSFAAAATAAAASARARASVFCWRCR